MDSISSCDSAMPPDAWAAIEHFFQQPWSDGFPMVPPTDALVRQMLATVGRSPEEVVGLVAPRFGEATVESLAVHAVLPFLAGTARLAIAAGIGWLVAAYGAGLAGLFGAVAMSSVVYGLLMLVAARRIRLAAGVNPAARRPG